MNKQHARQPAFLLGAPRSGTSLIYKALCLHPDAAFISQWVQRYPKVPMLSIFDRVARLSNRAQAWAWFPAGNAYAYGRRRSLLERIYPAPAEGESVFTEAGIPIALVEHRPAIGVEIERLRHLFRSIRRWNGGSVLVVKRIANNRRVPLLDAAFPRASYVEIVRDGRAVALSLSKVNWWGRGPVWWLGRSPDEWEQDGGDPLELAARHWTVELETLEAAAAGIPPDRYLRVRYEDVIEHPVLLLQTVAEFIGLDPNDVEWLSKLDELDLPDKNQRWRQGLAEAEIATIEAVQAKLLSRHAYPLLTIDRK